MNKKMIRILALSLLLTLVIVTGCDNRGTNIPARPVLDRGGAWIAADHIFSPQLRFQFQNDLERFPMWIYIPQVAWDPPLGESRPVPVLILLAPQFGDKFYYANHGLETLLKEMIADGTIQPMIVACVANSPTFGGYLYAGGTNFENLPYPTSGAYDYIIGNLQDSLGLVPYLRRSLHILPGRQKTGIGGVGMGAYGAFRAALLYDTTFGSITVTDGPLDFDGAPGLGNGLVDLFDDALMEQGLLNANDSLFRNTFDSSSATPLSNMFIGGAFAFSPHDTVIYHHMVRPFATPIPPDAYPEVDSTLKINNPADTLTKVIGFFGPGTPYRFNYHLPFNANGSVYAPIWDNFWVTENLENLLDTANNKLNGVDIWIGTTNQAKYNFYQQTQSWINTLTSPPYNYTVTERPYQGTPSQPATADQYLYDLLKEMLIFHSESFGN